MKRRSLLAGAAAMSVMAVPGCTVVNWARDNEIIVRAAVRQATLRAIDGNIERAARAREIIASVRERVADDIETTVREVANAVRAEIHWESMGLADRELLALVIDSIELRLQERVGESALDPAALVTVRTVLTWAYLAAAMVT